MGTILEPRINQSSQRLVLFLEEALLHKKDFAEMIGVTLSYVYNLLNPEEAFPTRSTTLERIAMVMDAPPDSFPEYRGGEEQTVIDAGVRLMQHRQRELGLSMVSFLKKLPRGYRLSVVDMWRGASPLPLDWAQVQAIGDVLELPAEKLYPFWENRLQHYLIAGGLDPVNNSTLLQGLFSGVQEALDIKP